METTITIVIMNEQHSLLPEQEKILNEKFNNSWEFMKVPADGWALYQMREKIMEIIDKSTVDNNIFVVFVSPIPYMLKIMVSSSSVKETFVFHNDNRIKKELPNGKIISVVAETGWCLL